MHADAMVPTVESSDIQCTYLNVMAANQIQVSMVVKHLTTSPHTSLVLTGSPKVIGNSPFCSCLPLAFGLALHHQSVPKSHWTSDLEVMLLLCTKGHVNDLFHDKLSCELLPAWSSSPCT